MLIDRTPLTARRLDDRWTCPPLDGVRGIALLIVLLAHTRPQIFPGGNIGVDLFFVLSGFLITTLLLREHAAHGTISVGYFYVRRALRLFPALYALVFFVVLYVAWADRGMLRITLDNAISVIFYVWNWKLALNWGGDGWVSQHRLTHLWSLSVEEQFYILWPFLLSFVLAARGRVFGVILAVGIIIPAIGRILLWDEGPRLDLYFRTDLRFDSLMWGAAAAWLVFTRPISHVASARIVVAGMVGLAAFLVMARFNLLSNGVLYMGGYSIMLAIATLIVVAAAQDQPSVLRTVLTFRPLRWTGKISYGLYLWHVPVFYIAHEYIKELWLMNVVALVATFAISSASFYLWERPFLRIKNRFER